MSMLDHLRRPESTVRDQAAQLRRLRVAVTLFFGLGGFLYAGWAVRIPALKNQIGATPGSLGLALLCMTGSAVLTMAVTGRLCERFGSRQVTIVSAVLLSVSVVVSTLAHSVIAFGLLLILFGAAYGAIDVAINSVAVELIVAMERPVMPTFHAANSFGSLAGAGLGGVLASHLSPTAHMMIWLPAGVVATAAAGSVLLSHPLPARPEPHHPSAGRVLRRISLPVVVFGLIGLCAAFCQGALDNWVPLHIRDDLSGTEIEAATGYAAVQGVMGVMRLTGGRLLERFGTTRVAVVGGLVACGGTLLAALAPVLPLVFAGLVITGFGLANIFPVAMAQAGIAGGPSGVAVAATLGYCGILAAPPSIGLLADAFTLPAALTLISTLAAVAALISFLIRSRVSEKGNP